MLSIFSKVSFVLDIIFKSNEPTVEAFEWIIFSEFHSSLILLFSFKNFLKPSKINFPDLSSKADSPIITKGFLKFENSLLSLFSLLKNFLISSVELPMISYSYVSSPGLPNEKILVLLFKKLYLILAFTIVASCLGFAPTKIIQSASSIPFIDELKI